MNRRTVLRSAGLAACALAGCTASPATTLAHHVTVRNWSTARRTVGVIVEGESETLFDHRYELEPGTDRDGYGFHGEATTVAAIVDGHDHHEFSFTDVRCSGRSLAGIVLTITEDNGLDLTYDCTTVRDPTTPNGNASRV